MTCPRCDGLLVLDDEDSAKCCNCGYRRYAPLEDRMDSLMAEGQRLAAQLTTNGNGHGRCQKKVARGTCKYQARENGYCEKHGGETAPEPTGLTIRQALTVPIKMDLNGNAYQVLGRAAEILQEDLQAVARAREVLGRMV